MSGETTMGGLAWLDCQSGIAGDMVLAALLDCGVPAAVFADVIEALGLCGVSVRSEPVARNGFRALRVRVCLPEDPAPHHTHLGEILARIDGSGLPVRVREGATFAFRSLAEAESRVHGCSVESVHFHEVGGLDAQVDIACAMAGFYHLGVAAVHVSPLPVGTGTVTCEHGVIPLPAPAVVEMLPGVLVRGVGAQGETVTPTGLAILKGLHASFEPPPAFVVKATGRGAGSNDLGLPGPLRLVFGAPVTGSGSGPILEHRVEVCANIDDMNPQWFDEALDRLAKAGAVDTWITPVVMKKGRPGHMLAALTDEAHQYAVAFAMLQHTTTIGVRLHRVERRVLPRAMVEVTTRWGAVPVKVARIGGEWSRATPEYDVVRAIARKADLPIERVAREAAAAATKMLERAEDIGTTGEGGQ